MNIEYGDDRTTIHLDAREHAILLTLLGDIEVSPTGYFEQYQEDFLKELEEKL